MQYGLEVIDVDDAEVLAQFVEAANWQGLGEVLQRLLHQRTPGGAGHFAYLCAEWAGNTILARRPGSPDEPPAVTLIETRGAGGQVVSAPTPPGIHPEHPERGYELVRGSWEDLPTITPEARQALLALARSFNTYVDPKQVHTPRGLEKSRTTASGLVISSIRLLTAPGGVRCSSRTAGRACTPVATWSTGSDRAKRGRPGVRRWAPAARTSTCSAPMPRRLSKAAPIVPSAPMPSSTTAAISRPQPWGAHGFPPGRLGVPIVRTTNHCQACALPCVASRPA